MTYRSIKMINVYKALLTETISGKLTFSDLFKCGAGVQTNTSKTGYTVANVAQARVLVFSVLQSLKNSTETSISFSYPNGTTEEYATKLEAITDLKDKLDTYFPNI